MTFSQILNFVCIQISMGMSFINWKSKIGSVIKPFNFLGLKFLYSLHEVHEIVKTMNCDMKYSKYKWAFMQDGATCHTCSQTIEWISQRAVVVPGWPPNSPDLNPIEMCGP